MGFWDSAMSWIGGSTPAGVTAQTASAAITSFVGGIDEIIKDVHLSPESQIKFEVLKAQLSANIQVGQMADMASARGMQSALKSRMPAFLTLFYTTGFLSTSGILLYLSFAYPAVNLSPFQAGLVGAIWGALAKEAAVATSFWLGASPDSGPELPPLTPPQPIGGK